MIIEENILICTIIRNCESHVLNWYLQIKNYTSLLKSKNFSLSVYENDSTDNTKKILNSLDFSFLKNISIISENLNTEFYKTDFEKNKDRLTRVKNLSNARNKCLYNSNLNINDYKKIILKNDLKLNDDNFVSNFAFPIVNKNRNLLAKELLSKQIEIRPLIAGSMAKQPFWIKKYGILNLPNCDIIDKHGFYIPNNHLITEEQIKFISDIINFF